MKLDSAEPNRKAMDVEPLAIEIIGLRKQYGRATVLDELSLSVGKGEFIVILGDSGSGKSTLLKLIAGLELPQSGTIRIEGLDQARRPPHNRDVAMVFQDGNGYEHLTVRQNLDLAAKHSPEPNQVSRWVDWLQLEETLDQKLTQLSGGQAQRLAIARAMLSGKSVVLLDEPLAHLNQTLREECRELILRVHRETKKTFLYVTHDSDEAFYLANRIAVLASGRIQQVGDPLSVYRSPHSKVVAKLLGHPTVDILKIKKGWLVGGQNPDASLIECGVRSHDWRIRYVDLESPQDITRQVGLSMNTHGLLVKGAIGSCRWMGNRWLLEIECPERIRITCESPCPEPLESKLLSAESSSRAVERSKPFGYLEATLLRSSIQTFDNLECWESSQL